MNNICEIWNCNVIQNLHTSFWQVNLSSLHCRRTLSKGYYDAANFINIHFLSKWKNFGIN
jgi:hypothetical protein